MTEQPKLKTSTMRLQDFINELKDEYSKYRYSTHNPALLDRVIDALEAHARNDPELLNKLVDVEVRTERTIGGMKFWVYIDDLQISEGEVSEAESRAASRRLT